MAQQSKGKDQKNKTKKTNQTAKKLGFFSVVWRIFLWLLLAAVLGSIVYVVFYTNIVTNLFSVEYVSSYASAPPPPHLDITAYQQKLDEISHIATSTVYFASTTVAIAYSTSTPTPASERLWPAKAGYPNYGALLPFNRIVAYYGNFLSTAMGVLGEYPPAQVITMLQNTVAEWQAADPTTPVIPAIDYIAVTAQGSPGADGKYRLRMPASQIQQAINMAAEVNGIVILDVQVGLSNVQTEIPLLEPYLKLPNVELAIDPEFAMHNGAAPGTVVGSVDATDINFAANYLASLVRANNLPPKILIVHRFTDPMVTNAQNIMPLPQVEVVMDMDGWGAQSRKIATYQEAIYRQPVQFTGFKLFYKNDLLPPSTALMTPAQVLKLTPAPLFIQYQ